MNLVDLPYDILILFQKYLKHATVFDRLLYSDMNQKGILDAITNEEKTWINFVNVSTSFRELKRRTLVLVLSKKYAIKYLQSKFFQTRVDNLVENRSEQLHFIVHSVNIEREDYFPWHNSLGISFLQINYTIDASAFSNLRFMNLYYTAVIFVCNLVNLVELRASNCGALKTIYNLPALQRMFIDTCESLETISALPSLQKLWLLKCTDLFNLSVPALQRLAIKDCPNLQLSKELIKSITYHLTIDYMNQHIDEASLSSASHLNSIGIYRAFFSFEINSTYFLNIRSLCIQRCFNTAISNLPLLNTLRLCDCSGLVIHFDSLPSLRILRLRSCREIRQITITGSSKNTETFPTLHKVEFHHCPDLQKIVIERKVRLLIVKSETSLEVVTSKLFPVQYVKMDNVGVISQTNN